MKNFQQFLSEAGKTWSESDFKAIVASSKTLEDFDQHAGEALRNKYLPRLIDFLNTYKTGDIPNPVFINIKDTANRFAEDATKMPARIYALVRGNRTIDHYDFNVSSTHVVPGKLKKAEALLPKVGWSGDYTDYLKWLIPILKELAPMAAAVEDMKGRAVKRVVKTDAEKKAEKSAVIKGFASKETTKAIWNGLTEMTDALKVKYAESLEKMYIPLIDKAEAVDPAERQKARRQYGYQTPAVEKLPVWEYEMNGCKLVRTKTWKADLRRMCARIADTMQESFLAKNVAKLDSIAEAKGVNLAKKPRVLNLSTSGGLFTGEMRLEFKDGSGFTVRNKVVVKMNSHGTVFNQFPTTFHDVIMPDGTPMGAPSESRMNTVFVGK